MAVAFMMFIKELLWNGGESAICRRFFLPFFAELDIFESFEAMLFFTQKYYPNIVAFDTCNISIILLFKQKNHKYSVQMLA